MKLIGNYSDWIKQEWIDCMLSNDGWCLPRDYGTDQKSRIQGMVNYCGPISCERALNGGYDFSKIHYRVFNKTNVPFNLKFSENEDDIEWRFVKLLPGDVMPMHLDSDEPDLISKKYWMPLQDYQNGHVFIWGETSITGWKKGNIYQFEDNNEWHGACNIGYSPRIILNLNVWNPNLDIFINGIS